MSEERKKRRNESPAIVEIPLNGEHSLHLDDDIFAENMLMTPAYSAALSALKGILRDGRRYSGEQKYKSHVSSGEFYEQASNVIAFCANRGQGKTSVMMSFTNALKCKKNLEKIKDRWKQEDGTTAGESYPLEYVHVLPPIDPTLLEGSDMLIEEILSRMLSYFHQHSSNAQSYQERETRDFSTEVTKLYRTFKKCQDSVQTLKSGGRRDTLEDLERYGESLDLKTEFYYLILQFFQMLGKDKTSSYLLVRLDDTDLQFKKAYEILEEVRKYLALPNVLVVMAVHLNQLRMLVTQNYYKDLDIRLKTLQGSADAHEKAVDNIHLMATKYLDKLIPSTHAIYLPTMRGAFDNSSDKENAVMLLYPPATGPEPMEIHQAVFRFIHRKTGLFFIRHRYYMHSIIPSTLRGLSHLLRFLRQMPDPPSKPTFPKKFSESVQNDIHKERSSPEWLDYCNQRLEWAERIFANLLRFEDYFLNDWCSSRIDEDDWQRIRDIQDAVPAKSVQQAIYTLRNKNQRIFKNSDDKEQSSSYIALTNLIDPEVIGYTRYDYSFAFAVHTYFSIQFHKIVLEEQMEALRNELRSAHDRKLEYFSFNYSRLQTLLKPRIFDTEFIQKELNNALGDKAPKVYFKLTNSQSKSVIESSQKSLFARGKEIGGLFFDPLYCFYQALAADNELIEEDFQDKQRRILRLQDYVTFVCCNWDVQDQITKSMIRDEENMKRFSEWMNEYSEENIKRFSQRMNEYKQPGTLEYMNAFFDYIHQYIAQKENILNMKSAWKDAPKELEKTPLQEYFVYDDPLFRAKTVEELIKEANASLEGAKNFIEAVKNAVSPDDQTTKTILENEKEHLTFKYVDQSGSHKGAEIYLEDAHVAYEHSRSDEAEWNASVVINMVKEAVRNILDRIADIAQEAITAAEELTDLVQNAGKKAKDAAEIAEEVAIEALDASNIAEEEFNAGKINEAVSWVLTALAKADETKKAIEDAKRKATPRKRGGGRKSGASPTTENLNGADDKKTEPLPTAENFDGADDKNGGGDAP